MTSYTWVSIFVLVVSLSIIALLRWFDRGVRAELAALNPVRFQIPDDLSLDQANWLQAQLELAGTEFVPSAVQMEERDRKAREDQQFLVDSLRRQRTNLARKQLRSKSLMEKVPTQCELAEQLAEVTTLSTLAGNRVRTFARHPSHAGPCDYEDVNA